jgi:hypothetical protein
MDTVVYQLHANSYIIFLFHRNTRHSFVCYNMAMDQETSDPPSWLGGVMGGACLAPLAGGGIGVSTGRED